MSFVDWKNIVAVDRFLSTTQVVRERMTDHLSPPVSSSRGVSISSLDARAHHLSLLVEGRS
ncbi:hypothetical protein CVT26_003980 [Gymnopilus dilepis]|uniref:Uncharacterized protein n=1 Tax=Gymnopilus dilepis TaxID=231916 RepID=A0A409X3A7_9AGAR|nr:hypothetical protein CVT26_003980 [Gymnopilus dilepis]